MTEYNEEKIYNNIEALTRQLYNVLKTIKTAINLHPVKPDNMNYTLIIISGWTLLAVQMKQKLRVSLIKMV